jgi:hypothetical protein
MRHPLCVDAQGSAQVNYETLNRDVLIAVVLFAVLLYVGMVCAGFAEFMARISKRGNCKKCSRNRGTARGLRKAKRPTFSPPGELET